MELAQRLTMALVVHPHAFEARRLERLEREEVVAIGGGDLGDERPRFGRPGVDTTEPRVQRSGRQQHPYSPERCATVAQLPQPADLIVIRGPVTDPYETRLRGRLAPEAQLERCGGRLRVAGFHPADGHVEDVAEAGDERREEGSESRMRARREVPVAKGNHPTARYRLNRLPNGADHDRNARPRLAQIDRASSRVPEPVLGADRLPTDPDAYPRFRYPDLRRGGGRHVIPANPRLGRGVAADAQRGFGSRRCDRRGRFRHSDIGGRRWARVAHADAGVSATPAAQRLRGCEDES